MNDDETRKAQTKALFNRLVPDYAAAGPGTFAHYGRRLVEIVGVESGQRVLDVATGRGAVLFPAAERVGEAGEAVGVDLAEGMVQATNEEAARRGLGARVLVMDAERLDFPDATFDRVLLRLRGHVLSQSGPSVARVSARAQARGPARRVHLADVAERGPRGGPGRSGARGGQPAAGWITEPDELARRLQRAGLTDVRVVADSETFRYADLEQYWQTARGTGSAASWTRWTQPRLERVRATLPNGCGPISDPTGLTWWQRRSWRWRPASIHRPAARESVPPRARERLVIDTGVGT